jgi:hypothetical protein
LKTHEEDTKLFFIQHKLHWHIYKLLPCCTVSEKLPKISLFGPSLIHQLWLLGSQQHLQNGVILTSFLSASAIGIMSWQDVTQSSLCSGVEECATKHAHNFLFPKSSLRIQRTTVLGMFKDSAIILDEI